jgi:hypothetical protein
MQMSDSDRCSDCQEFWVICPCCQVAFCPTCSKTEEGQNEEDEEGGEEDDRTTSD